MKIKSSLIALCILICNTFVAQSTIIDARSAGAGATITTKGIVTNGQELGVIRYLQDATGGLAIYDTNFASTINRGDSVLVTGVLADFNGLLEITQVSNLVVLNTGNTLPEPFLYMPSQIVEATEGTLVRINQLSFTNAGGTFAGGTSYTFQANGQSLSIYVRNGSPLVGQPIPGGQTDMVGISSQYLANYQILPRDMSDFITGPGINITSAVTQTGLTTFGFTLNWTTDIAGNSGVQYGLTPALEMGEQSNGNMLTNHSFPLFGVDAGQIYYCRAFSVAGSDTAFSPVRPFGVVSNSSGTILSYFNTSVDNSVASNQNAVQLLEAIDDTLIAYINRAEVSLDLTIYDFINDGVSNISDAINAAADRGVQVRFISDGTLAATNTAIGELNEAVAHLYSPVGDAYNIMHNKFVIIDANHSDPMKPLVWTGSTNWTERQLYTDNNSVIIVQDQTLARAYTMEFNEMWGSSGPLPDTAQSRFGSFKLDNTPHEFRIGNKRVESYFSPSDNVNSKLIETINTADANAYFASMLITRNDVAQALIDKHAAGIVVQGIINDPNSTSQYSILSAELGADLFINPDTSIIMHHKYLIVDQNALSSDPLLWVGSHNWSTNANTRNDENTLIVHDANIANQYYQEFMSLIAFEPVAGCTDANACNFNSVATIDDGSCLFIANPCDDGDANTISDAVNLSCECVGVIAVLGCTDIDACNFSLEANVEDNSCLYEGSPCDDGNAETLNDVINSSCLCEGIINNVDELQESAALSCFPNPANDRLNIQFTSALGGIASIVISDLTGKTCANRTLSFGTGINVQSIHVDTLPAGTYFVSMVLDGGSVHTVFVKE